MLFAANLAVGAKGFLRSLAPNCAAGEFIVVRRLVVHLLASKVAAWNLDGPRFCFGFRSIHVCFSSSDRREDGALDRGFYHLDFIRIAAQRLGALCGSLAAFGGGRLVQRVHLFTISVSEEIAFGPQSTARTGALI